MAKSKVKRVPKKKKSQRNRRTVVSMGLTKYQSLLNDPCNATVEGFYGGDTGITQRFVGDYTFNTTAGFTAGYVVFTPAANVLLYAGNASPAVAITPAGITNGPAATWLGAAAIKIRPLAACLEMIPSAVSLTNMTGETACAILNASNITTLSSLSTDAVFQLCNDKDVLEKRDYEVKWFPGALDHTYAPVWTSGAVAGTASLSDQADNNSVVIAWKGYPAGAALSFRATNVLEWCPQAGTGLAAQSAPRVPHDTQREAAVLHKKKPSWWNNFKKKHGHQMQQIGEKVLIRLIEFGGEKALAAMEGA